MMKPPIVISGMLLWILWTSTFMAAAFTHINPIAPQSSREGKHIFLRGEAVWAQVPVAIREEAVQWRVLDDRLDTVAVGAIDLSESQEQVEIGVLDIGWYRIDFLDKEQNRLAFTTKAVLEPLGESNRADSPIAIDGALSWFPGPSDKESADLVRLAQWSGVAWIRDRLRWRDMESAQGLPRAETLYDRMADLQHDAGMQVLQVFHDIPIWARPSEEAGTPVDLRHPYRFCAAMATRFRGRVQAWEPWNEGNAGNFGGLSIDALCAWQKAAWLGFKSSDKSVTVGWNPLGGINNATLTRGILENESWPYFDTYNLHEYNWSQDYERLWTHARRAACGRPLWVTECDRGMKADASSALGDFSEEFDCRKAEYIVQAYVHSLFNGAARHFHFILGHYMEGENSIQFGLLRKDFSPRRSYVALATLGRLLNGAQCLGRLPAPEDFPHAQAYAFEARPFGKAADVLVVWAEKKGEWKDRGQQEVPWPYASDFEVQAAYDYLGRSLSATLPEKLGGRPVFLILPQGSLKRLALDKIAQAPYRKGPASPVVLQLNMPKRQAKERVVDWAHEHYYEMQAGESLPIEIWCYNFSDEPVRGLLSVEKSAPGWKLDLPSEPIQIKAMGRIACHGLLHVAGKAPTAPTETWFKIRGRFQEAGNPALAFYAIAKEGGNDGAAGMGKIE